MLELALFVRGLQTGFIWRVASRMIMVYRHFMYISPTDSRFNRNLGEISFERETSNGSVDTGMID
jgi:hypothetical protein